MLEQEQIDTVLMEKMDSQGNAHFTHAGISKEEPFEAGGLEGTKYKHNVSIEKNERTREIGMISKELDSDTARQYVYMFSQLRKANLPVPNTTRYFEKEGKCYVIMSDLTEGGKYPIWSYNGSYYQREVDMMQTIRKTIEDLDAGEKEEFTNKAYELADKCAESGFKVLSDSYCIKEKEGELSFHLLDLGHVYMDGTLEQRLRQNRLSMEKFLYVLSKPHEHRQITNPKDKK
jgi:hypothetical protein